MTDPSRKRPALWRLAMWGALATLLSLPAIFRFPWTASDFVIMGIMLAASGSASNFWCGDRAATPIGLAP